MSQTCRYDTYVSVMNTAPSWPAGRPNRGPLRAHPGAWRAHSQAPDDGQELPRRARPRQSHPVQPPQVCAGAARGPCPAQATLKVLGRRRAGTNRGRWAGRGLEARGSMAGPRLTSRWGCPDVESPGELRKGPGAARQPEARSPCSGSRGSPRKRGRPPQKRPSPAARRSRRGHRAGQVTGPGDGLLGNRCWQREQEVPLDASAPVSASQRGSEKLPLCPRAGGGYSLMESLPSPSLELT